jgi:hypothetical protein
MMGGSAGLHTDQASWQLLEKHDYLPAPQLPRENWRPGAVDTMYLKNALR